MIVRQEQRDLFAASAELTWRDDVLAGSFNGRPIVTDQVTRAASISECGQYRYSLTRIWDDQRPSLPVIMLNPSTADAEQDDPTIRRCMAFAAREGFGGIEVLNLFAFRATSPADMIAAADPIGPGCSDRLDAVLKRSAETGIPVLAAWGAHGAHQQRGQVVARCAANWGAKLVCLGTTADGHPRHPLYVRGDQSLVPLDAAA
jgi:hypothetical protein